MRLSALVLASLSLLPAASARADVRITISDGYVSVEAKDATVRQILAEWSRVGQTRIVNAERVGGIPITLSLVRVPEARALDILLRSVSGYMAAPRAVPMSNASQFDRILVMPTSTPPRVAQTPAAQQPQAFQPPQNPIDDDIDEDPGPPGGPPQRGPVFPQFPNPAAGGPVGSVPPAAFPGRGPAFPQGAPFSSPNAASPNPNQVFPQGPFGMPPGVVVPPGVTIPAGVSVPGMVAQPTLPPGQVSPNDPQ